MILTKTIQSLLIVLVFSAQLQCNSEKKRTTKINYDRNKLDSLVTRYGKNLALLSCIRCGCFVEAYNKIPAFQQTVGYRLLTDKNCNKMKFPVEHISQRDMQAISEDFYNLTLIKSRDNGISFKILTIQESKAIDKEAKRFFDD